MPVSKDSHAEHDVDPTANADPMEEGSGGWNALTWLLLAAGLGFAVVCVAASIIGRHPFLIDWTYYLQRADKGVIETAWIALEGHRQFLPRLAAALEYDFTAGRNLVLASSALLAHVVMAVVVVAVLLTEMGLNGVPGRRGIGAMLSTSAGRAMTGLALVLLFFVADMEQFIRGESQINLISWAVSFSVLAIACLGHALNLAPARRLPWLALLTAFAVAASLTSMAGPLVWLTMLYMVIICRGGWLTTVWILLAAAASFALFLEGNTTSVSHYARLVLWTEDPLGVLIILASFLGAPVSKAMFVEPFASWHFQGAVLVGGIGLLAQALLLIESLWRRPADGAETAALGILLVSGFWNAGYILGHFVPGELLQNYLRFWQLIAVAWLALAFLIYRRWGWDRKLYWRGITVAGLLAAVGFAPSLAFTGIQAQAHSTMVHAMGSAVAVVVRDEALHAPTSYFVGDEQMAALARLLAERRIQPVHDAAARAVGKPLAGAAAASACVGTVAGTVAGTGAVPGTPTARRIWGSWPAETAALADGIAITDRAGTVVGVAREWRSPWFQRFFPRLGPGAGANQWYGYFRPSSGAPWTAVALDSAGRPMCRLGVLKG